MFGADDTLDVTKMVEHAGYIGDQNVPKGTEVRLQVKDSVETAIAGAHPAYAALRGDTDGVLPDSGIKSKK